MGKKKALKLEAQKLRSRGNTYSEIQKALGARVPKSTLSDWCRNVKLPKSYTTKVKKLNKLNLARARAMAVAVNKKNRDLYLDGLSNKNIHLLKLLDIPTQKLLLSILYLAEGAKHKSSRYLMLGSSNPKIVNFYLTLLKNSFPISDDKFRARVQCRYDQNTDVLEKFWCKTTGVNKRQFYRTYKDKRTKGSKTTKKDYMGVCAVYYFDTSIQLELELLADAVMKKINGPLAQ